MDSPPLSGFYHIWLLLELGKARMVETAVAWLLTLINSYNLMKIKVYMTQISGKPSEKVGISSVILPICLLEFT